MERYIYLRLASYTIDDGLLIIFLVFYCRVRVKGREKEREKERVKDRITITFLKTITAKEKGKEKEGITIILMTNIPEKEREKVKDTATVREKVKGTFMEMTTMRA